MGTEDIAESEGREMKKTNIKVACRNDHSGDKTMRGIPAFVFGLIAVHREILQIDPEIIYDSESWNITHIPTGYTIIRGMPYKMALSVRRKLQALDWVFDDVQNVPKQTEIKAKAIRDKYWKEWENL